MRAICMAGFIVWCAAGAVVDRIAVVVGKTVITESEVLEEVRVTEFLNGQPLDLGPQQRRAAAERIVDQELIRNEMRIGHYQQPAAAEVDRMLDRAGQDHAAGGGLGEALAKYGLTGEQLKRHLEWQVAVMRFTEQRFGAGLPQPSAASENGANRLAPGTDTSPAEDAVEQRMEAWLKQVRSETRVQFKEEAFQ